MTCAICGHSQHEGRCGYPITEDVRDDVGIFAPATGITRTLIVDTCACGLVDSLAAQFGG